MKNTLVAADILSDRLAKRETLKHSKKHDDVLHFLYNSISTFYMNTRVLHEPLIRDTTFQMIVKLLTNLCASIGLDVSYLQTMGNFSHISLVFLFCHTMR